MVKLADEIAASPGIELSIAFPYKENLHGVIENISYYSFNVKNEKVRVEHLCGQEKRITDIIRAVMPDCIHIFGTEYAHSYAFTEVAKSLGIIDNVMISIQGLVSVYAIHYDAFLPYKIVTGFTIRDIYRGNMFVEKKRFERNGKLEIAAIKNVNHVLGRTDWDRACTFLINPNAVYHNNNEMLRESFYHIEPWKYEDCIHHLIFMSQGALPLKGLHLALRAMVTLKPFFPDIQLRIAGNDFTKKKKYKLSYYEKSILTYISDNNLEGNVSFTGYLDETQIIKEYKQCNVFICPSSIENSPNSVCEAMMTGVPVIASFVGGLSNLIKNKTEGFLYQADASYMLAYYLYELFVSGKEAEKIGKCARDTAIKRHDISRIVNELIGIYSEVATI